MVAIIKIASLISVAASFASAAAIPAAIPKSNPLITPGPGMPTLQDLGLSEEAFKQKRDEVLAEFKAHEASSLQKRFNNQCWSNGESRCSTAEAAALVAYLRNLGTTSCVVTEYETQFVSTPSGSCRLLGQNRSNNDIVSSYCVDVAKGLDWVMGNCQVGSTVGGVGAANGNGGLATLVTSA